MNASKFFFRIFLRQNSIPNCTIHISHVKGMLYQYFLREKKGFRFVLFPLYFYSLLLLTMPLLVAASGGEAIATIATAILWPRYNNGQVPQIAEQACFQSEAQLRRAQIHNRPHQLHRGSHQRVAQGQLDLHQRWHKSPEYLL